MDSTLHYTEIRPAPAFADQIVCYWSHRVDDDNAGFVQPVYPDGCVDILWRRYGDGAWESPVIVGAMTGVRAAALSPGLSLQGIRLVPGQAARLFGVPAHEYTDLELGARELPGFRRFAAEIPPTANLNRVFARLLALGPASRSTTRTDCALDAAVRAIARNPGIKMATLAARAGISERQLHRRFLQGVGYSPKHFQRILRFQRFLSVAAQCRGRDQSSGTPHSLADLALAAGYADQAHLGRDCRALAGRTPGALLADSHPALAISDLFRD